MGFVFTFGSLMWDNALASRPGRPARLEGFHREFVHLSRRRWGSPQAPCPIVGLEPGGECWGVAYRLEAADEKAALRKLDRREGERCRRERREVWVDGARVPAWVYLSRPNRVANGMGTDDEIAEACRRAHGVVGTGVEYVRTLQHAMQLWKIHDPLIERLWEKVRP